ncbi:MAG: acyltransferase [Henriciella sp.]|uniref:acyltransferase family protein n=1 Tax=Henriciella sp. TaxID=1968823 RepID=UPI003C739097
MTRLAALSQGRNNNLNLIRFVAAAAVLVSHAWPMVEGPGTTEPLEEMVGHSLGTLAVFVFFVISGFLITASFQRSSSRTSFILSRLLRLFPALLVNLLFVALLLGPVVTTIGARAYFASGEPFLFVMRDLALFPLMYELPGVFVGQPIEAVVGSIWTLRHEVLCYAGVFAAGVLGFFTTRERSAALLGLYAVIWFAVTLSPVEVPGTIAAFHRLSVPYAIGVAFWIWREQIPLSSWALVPMILLAFILADTLFAFPAFIFVLAYATFVFAYLPGGTILRFNELGDYSYGMYVYAFPIQGLAVYLFGAQTPLQNIAYSMPATLLLAIVSWHSIEAPAMAAKPRVLSRACLGASLQRGSP